ncbi:DUF1656 domain-containing protein [Shewanella dokdonensis]|uniref:DUF1656 domain-containing protein n=1 Tax=Shewanella dokdonensis TaxID=712036 RepID=A0ABX8DJG1_9GAMM|nr:DUF1656 domain-containing protein [Shewanella dokdonensis]MCL1076138.1 DUF1656 domain-containing protein [Shewanella dokdonensis]QVK24470.1 DUF1656 domain-containing protein [Shewanella dokdonensis]
MLREIAFHSFYIPTVTLMFTLGYFLTLALNQILMITGAYRYIWHPTLFRIAFYIAISSALSLTVYH